jgi:glyoxylase-like metal-dependent hydrolase (beta-lactamase superfamily II)
MLRVASSSVYKKCLAGSAVLVWISTLCFPILSQDESTVVDLAVKATGAVNLKTVQIFATGSVAGVGQSATPTSGWPTTRVKSWRREINLDSMASSVESVRLQNGTDTPFTQVIGADSSWELQYGLWLTPYGFLKGAKTHAVTVSPGSVDKVKYNVVSYTVQNKYKVEGYINDQNMVARVRTWIDNDVLGDMLCEATYDDYRDFDGVKVPGIMIVKQGGFATSILVVSDAKANIPVSIPAATVPPLPPAVTVVSEKIADGVYYLTGGTHHSVLVEFGDHVTLIEAPLNEARSLALLTEVKRIYPNKPLTEVVNTHHHFDHAGGLRTFVDSGVAIITQDLNKKFYERTFAAPRTLNPDKLERSKKKANIVTFSDKKVLTDSLRTLELYLVKNNPHSDDIVMAFLPKEKVLVEADLYTPAEPNVPGPVVAPPGAVALLTNLESLRLDFNTILPLHGPGRVSRAELYTFVHKPYIEVSMIPVSAAPSDRSGPMAELVNRACGGACHSLDRVNSKRGDKSAWTTIVERMKDKGADLTDEQVLQVVDYLASIQP